MVHWFMAWLFKRLVHLLLFEVARYAAIMFNTNDNAKDTFLSEVDRYYTLILSYVYVISSWLAVLDDYCKKYA